MKFYPIGELEKKTNPETLARARKLYEQDSLNIKLKELRGKYGIRQEEINNFSQTAVSKLENRKDLKISTLIDYLDSLGFGLEIIALPKSNKVKKEVLLKL